MNDPHVEALIYRISHGDMIDYSKAKRLERDEPEFRLTVEDRIARFDFKEHFSTKEQAQEVVGDYIWIWEFDATLKRGNPDSFRLEFVEAEIIDRNPSPDQIELAGSLSVSVGGSSKLTISACEYPSPPTDIAHSPDAEMMYQRYMGYCQGRELLPGMAFFCLSMLEGKEKGKRKRAAKRYAIDKSVLDRIGELSSERGGRNARKWEGRDQPLSHEECCFLNRAVKAVIRRVAEREHTRSGNLPVLSLSDLPSLDDRAPAGA